MSTFAKKAAFVQACKANEPTKAQQILQEGGSFDATLPVLAAGHLHSNILSMLLAQTHVQIFWNRAYSLAGILFTPLTMAVRMNRTKSIRVLLHHSKICCFASSNADMSALHMLVLCGNKESINEFVHYFVEKKYVHGLIMLLHHACAESCLHSTFVYIVKLVRKHANIDSPWLHLYRNLLEVRPTGLFFVSGFSPLQTLCANMSSSLPLKSIMERIGVLMACGATLKTKHYLPAALLAYRRRDATTHAARLLHLCTAWPKLWPTLGNMFAVKQKKDVTRVLRNNTFNPESTEYVAAVRIYMVCRTNYPQLQPDAKAFDAQNFVQDVQLHGWHARRHWLYPKEDRAKIAMFVRCITRNYHSQDASALILARTLPPEIMYYVLKFWRR